MADSHVRADSPGSMAAAMEPRFHSLILQHVSDAVIAIDGKGHVTYLNPTAERQYRITAAAAIGRRLGELYEYRWLEPGDETRAMEALARDGLWRGENKHVLRDGTVLHVESVVSAITDPAGAGALLAVVRDVTTARQAEAQIRDREERRRIALDAAQLGTWRHDVRTGQIELDARAQAHYGIPTPTCRADDVLARIHPDDLAPLQAAMSDALDPRTRRPVRTEYRILEPGGTVRWLSINGIVRFEWTEGGEQATEGIGTTREITDQKRAEDALRDADRRKDEFLAILAHELRNPLAPIRTAVGILRAANVPPVLEQRARDIIDRQVAQMARLVDDLLDVSRLSRGLIGLQRDHVRLDDVLDVAIETARPLIEDRHHALIDRRSRKAIVLDADLARLGQVFANLLNNAARYTPPGGTITLEVLESGEEVEVRVTDTGEGISPEHIETIFELFAQGGGGSASSAGGLGIGLALARQLVDMHGGSLTVSSPGLGRGATFGVHLPTLAPATSAGPDTVPPDPTAVRGNCRVLVVDDNTDAADMTAMLLESSGCSVRTAYGGEQAIRDAASFEPEVVLLDLGMPGIDGIEACRRIRQLPHGASIRIIALTGWGQEGSRRRTTLAGFDAHLVKPIAPEALLRLVREYPRIDGANGPGSTDQ